MTDVAHITLLEFATRIKNVLMREFASSTWVVSEISELKVNNSGHCYLDLVEKKGDQIAVRVGGVIWAANYRKLRQKFLSATGAEISQGMKLLLKVAVNFSEAYGLKLIVHDIDPSYSLGEMERQRKESIERLSREGVIDRNKQLPLGLPQRLAVISSGTAAGYGDFIDQLDKNRYGYLFFHKLYSAVMQGAESAESVASALNDIELSGQSYDAVIIIRGGGSVADLSCFDSYEMAKAVALFSIPVITGIGHDKDKSVVDATAHTSLKTPTAVAEFLIGTFRRYEDELIDMQRRITAAATSLIRNEKARADGIANKIAHAATRKISLMHRDIARFEATLRLRPMATIEKQQARMDSMFQKITLLEPANVLRRGYSITYLNGKAVKKGGDVKDGDFISTRLHEGAIKSKVINNNTIEGGKTIVHRTETLF